MLLFRTRDASKTLQLLQCGKYNIFYIEEIFAARMWGSVLKVIKAKLFLEAKKLEHTLTLPICFSPMAPRQELYQGPCGKIPEKMRILYLRRRCSHLLLRFGVLIVPKESCLKHSDVTSCNAKYGGKVSHLLISGPCKDQICSPHFKTICASILHGFSSAACKEDGALSRRVLCYLQFLVLLFKFIIFIWVTFWELIYFYSKLFNFLSDLSK